MNVLPYEDYSDELVELMKKNVTPILIAMPSPGTNSVVMGHDDPL